MARGEASSQSQRPAGSKRTGRRADPGGGSGGGADTDSEPRPAVDMRLLAQHLRSSFSYCAESPSPLTSQKQHPLRASHQSHEGDDHDDHDGDGDHRRESASQPEKHPTLSIGAAIPLGQPTRLDRTSRPRTAAAFPRTSPTFLAQLLWCPSHSTPLTTRQSLALALHVTALHGTRVSKCAAYFDRRVTTVEWHPHERHASTLVIGSKGGDLVWWDHERNGRYEGYTGGQAAGRDDESVPFLYGMGAGGAIMALKFHPHESSMVFTASVDGTLRNQDFEGKHSQIFHDTLNKEKWFTGLDVSADGETGVILAGMSTGVGMAFTLDGQAVWNGRLHKGKCHDVEFHPARPNLFVTAGHDKLLKLWDLRMMRRGGDVCAPVFAYEHTGILNSATFSRLPPYNVLTTTQDNECRVYDTSADPSVALVTSTVHPHRPFQHLTPIRGSWHTVFPNVFAVGRYPSTADDRRSVDVYQVTLPGSVVRDGSADGRLRLVSRMEDPRVTGIHCIAKFDHAGRHLATCSGYTTYLWPIETRLTEAAPPKKKRGRGTGRGDGDSDDDDNDGDSGADDDDGDGDGPSARADKRRKRAKGTDGRGGLGSIPVQGQPQGRAGKGAAGKAGVAGRGKRQ